MNKIKWLIYLPVLLLLVSCVEEPYEVIGVTDDAFKVLISPGNLTMMKEYEGCDALAVQWVWTKFSDYEDNPDVSYTLELAKAGTDFKDSYFSSLGKVGKKIYSVKEFNELLIKNGLVGNGESGQIEARLVATIGSYQGVRTEPVTFAVQTYDIDIELLPPYERIWFVGSFTDWETVEMKKDPDNPFLFSIVITLNDMSEVDERESTNEFKFTVSNKKDKLWWDNYKAPYKDAPITETQAVQVHNDVVNDFKWKLVGEELNKTYHIVLDITPGQERMYCTLLGDEPVEPPVPGGDEEEDEGGTDVEPEPVPAPSPEVGSYVRKQYVTEMEWGCPGDEGSVKMEDGWIVGLNYWRQGYIQMKLEDVPEDGYYYLISGLRCWSKTEYSYKTIYDETAKVYHFIPETLNALIEHRCVVYLKKGLNFIKIKGGSGKNGGFAPDFRYLVVSNGVTNLPTVEGNDQGEF